jgi:hypothetical protein
LTEERRPAQERQIATPWLNPSITTVRSIPTPGGEVNAVAMPVTFAGFADR